MEPATAALAAGAAQGVGSIISGISGSAQARQQAAVADQNARLAQQQAAADAAAIRNKGARVTGAQEAQAGASGIAGTGFADAIHDSEIENELDAQTALWNGQLKAASYRAQAAAARATGTSAMIGGILGAGSDAMSSYGNWDYLKTLKGNPAAAQGTTYGAVPGMERFGGVF